LKFWIGIDSKSIKNSLNNNGREWRSMLATLFIFAKRFLYKNFHYISSLKSLEQILSLNSKSLNFILNHNKTISLSSIIIFYFLLLLFFACYSHSPIFISFFFIFLIKQVKIRYGNKNIKIIKIYLKYIKIIYFIYKIFWNHPLNYIIKRTPYIDYIYSF
jgi:hypothetical protein